MNRININGIRGMIGGLILLSMFFWVHSALATINRNYNYLYFENGLPTPLSGVRRSQSEANFAGRTDPDIVIQTGYYSMRLELDTMNLSGFDALAGSDYLTALTTDVTTFSAGSLNLYAYDAAGTRYECNGGLVQDSSNQYVRFIEGGQFVQRFDTVISLVSPAGDTEYGRLEVTAWPDHVTFKLTPSFEGVTRTTIYLVTPNGTSLLKDKGQPSVTLSVEPQNNAVYGELSASSYITNAVDSSGTALSKSWDETMTALNVNVPAAGVGYPAAKTRVDEYTITVANSTNATKDVPIIFEQPTLRASTGTVMLLCNTDGSPTGIPVQVSKNWHGTAGDSPHEGKWLRGYTMIPLVAGASETFKLRVIYGYYGDGNFAAVSHSSLSLIGWSDTTTWKWDQAALGAWSESITYDISGHGGGAVMGDLRPTFTTPLRTDLTDHGWTENVGGGDFLAYYNSSGDYQNHKMLKTCYRWTGPNITEVLYSGKTADDKIRFTYTTRGVGTLDYLRRFHAYKYEFLDAVTSPQRLIFYQMAADYYPGPAFTTYYTGDDNGLLGSYTAGSANNAYIGSPISFSDSWLSIDDTTAATGDACHAHRGILSLSSTLNGNSFTPYIHPYGNQWGSNYLLFDLSASSVSRSYAAGDVVEGEIELILPSKNATNYWGEDAEFIGRLGTHSAAWNAVYDEYQYNRDLSVTMHLGTMLNNYPLEISAASGSVLANFTINGGGIGHVPVMVKDVAAGGSVQVQRFLNGAWANMTDVDIATHKYYQGYYNSSGTVDYAFNLKRPSSTLSESWQIRILTTGENPDAVVQMRKRNALGYCIDAGPGGENEQNVNLWSYIDGHVNQSWEEIDRGDGYYSYQKLGTNYSLDGNHGGANNQDVYLWETDATNYNQHWKKVDMGNGFFQLQKRNSLGFSINGGSGGVNGRNVTLWSSGSSSHNLQWLID